MTHELQILDRSGHTTKTWDDKVSDETVAEIESIFKTTLDKGYLAYGTNENGGDATQVKSFSEAQDYPKVVLTPPLAGG